MRCNLFVICCLLFFSLLFFFFFFFFNDTATTEIYTLSLHDALPILRRRGAPSRPRRSGVSCVGARGGNDVAAVPTHIESRGNPDAIPDRHARIREVEMAALPGEYRRSLGERPVFTLECGETRFPVLPVDVEDEQARDRARRNANVGVGRVGPPPRDGDRIRRGVMDPVGREAANRVFAGVAPARPAAGAAA